MMTGQVHGNGIQGKLPIKGLYFRDFGWCANDLQADFDQADRPELVTQILAGCALNQDGVSPSADRFWEASVGKRVQCLLTIALSGQMQALCCVQCTAQGCGESMEIDMDLAEIGELQQEADAINCIMIETQNRKIKLRKPSGIDQRRWLKQSYRTEQEVVASIIETLVCDDETRKQARADLITDDMVHAVNKAMKTADPLIDMVFSVCCPNCGRQGSYSFDLEEYALKKLKKAQMNLIQTIHGLARHYKWTESEILAIPPRRRSQYLTLIERGDRR
jgi:predicted nucleic-acid-binding protein